MNDRTAEMLAAVQADAHERRLRDDSPEPPPIPESCQDAEVQLKLTPQRHESIARTWSIEESNARFRRTRGETVVTEAVIDHVGNVRSSPPEIQNLAESLAQFKQQDVALDKVRASTEIEKIRAESHEKTERIRAQNRLDLEDRRHKNRMERIDRLQKIWLTRELLRQKHRKELEEKRTEGRLLLEDRRQKNRLELVQLKLEAAKDSRREAATNPPIPKSPNPSVPRSKEPYHPSAPYGRDPQTGRPYTKREYMIDARRSFYDIWGLDMPGEGDTRYRALNPDMYEHLVDEDGDLTHVPYHDYVDFDRDGLNEDGQPYLLPPPAGTIEHRPNTPKIVAEGAEKRKAAAEAAAKARHSPSEPTPHGVAEVRSQPCDNAPSSATPRTEPQSRQRAGHPTPESPVPNP